MIQEKLNLGFDQAVSCIVMVKCGTAFFYRTGSFGLKAEMIVIGARFWGGLIVGLKLSLRMHSRIC